MGSDCEHKCGGHCCRAFRLPHSPDELQELVQDLEADHNPLAPEYRQVASMVEYLGAFDVGAAPALIVEAIRIREESEVSHYYRCTNLAESGLCSIYDSRPKMCREYPYGQACCYTDCAPREPSE